MDKIKPIKIDNNLNEVEEYLEELRKYITKALAIDSNYLYGEDYGFSRTRE